MRLMKRRLAIGLMGVIIGSAMLLSGCRLAQSAANTQAEAAAPVAVQVPKTLGLRIVKRYGNWAQTNSLSRIRFSPDRSRFLATGRDSSVIDIYRTKGTERIATVHLERRQSLEIKTDFISNDQFYTNLDNARFQVYRVPDGTKIFQHQFEDNPRPIFANRQVALNEETLLYWQSGQTYTIPWAGPTTGFLGVTQDNAVLTEDMNAWVREENPATGRKVDWKTTGKSRVRHFMSTPDHRYLVTVNFDGACAVWRRGDKPALAGRCAEGIGEEDAVEGNVFSAWPDQYQLATTVVNRVRAYRIDPATGAPHQFFDQDMTARVWSVALNANGRLAVSLFDEGTQRVSLEVWDIAGRRPIARYVSDWDDLVRQTDDPNPDFRSSVIFRELGFSADGKLLLAIAGQSLLAFDVP